MITRNIASRLRRALKDTPVLFLHGARQTGKSTLANAIANSRRKATYLTLDDAATLAAATSDPTGFIAGLEGVQRVGRGAKGSRSLSGYQA